MTLSEEIKKAIEEEYSQWEAKMYAGMSKKDKQARGAFFTPPPLTIKMLEKFESVKDKDILDPTSGAGGLLAACIIAGADPYRIYGIELDKNVLRVSRLRLIKLGVPPWHLKQGDALDPNSYGDFDENVPKMFAAVAKEDNGAALFIVSSKKLIKEAHFTKANRDKLKKALDVLKAKGIRIEKI